jgi:hypothetical protein
MSPDSCSCCGAVRRPAELAPYYIGDVLRFACEAEECRALARSEIRGEVPVDEPSIDYVQMFEALWGTGRDIFAGVSRDERGVPS